MSDLAATNCGGSCGCNDNNGSWIWIILLLCCCGGCNGNNNGCSFGGGDCSCIIWILLILCFCGGNNSIF